MAPFNPKIHSFCLRCVNSLLHHVSRPLSASFKSVRYQVCPPKKNVYQVVSKITPQLLEQIQKKSLGAGGLQPGRLPHIFNTHPLNLPLLQSAECGLNVDKLKPLKAESRLYFSTSAVACKKKGNSCKKKSNKKRKKGNKCKKKAKKGGNKKKGKKKKKKKKAKECKKDKKEKPCKLNTSNSKCPNIKMNNCAPTSSKVCTRDATWPPCHKKCAPYPAYSESCHEDNPPPPSECRICPWSKDEHPTFKEKPRGYHTSASSVHRVVPMGETPLGVALRLPGAPWSTAPQWPFIDRLPSAAVEMLCTSKCGKEGGDDSCGLKVKKCKKDKKKKKKKGNKTDKCSKKAKKPKKKKKKKVKCNPKWRHPPCPKKEVKSKVCPKNLIKKPKCT